MTVKSLIRPVNKGCSPRELVTRLLVRPVNKKSLTCSPRELVRPIFAPLVVRPVNTLKVLPSGCVYFSSARWHTTASTQQTNREASAASQVESDSTQSSDQADGASAVCNPITPQPEMAGPAALVESDSTPCSLATVASDGSLKILTVKRSASIVAHLLLRSETNRSEPQPRGEGKKSGGLPLGHRPPSRFFAPSIRKFQFFRFRHGPITQADTEAKGGAFWP